MKTKAWRTLLRELRTRFPGDGKVFVRRYPLKNHCGTTSFDGRNYRIVVNSKLEWTAQVDALLHEWAHALAIEEAYRHTQPWGDMYAKIYRAWEENFTTGETP